MGIEFVKTHSKWLAPEIGQWIDDALNPASNFADVEKRAQDVLVNHLKVVTSSTRARYQFQSLTKREEVFKIIFDRVFEQNPDRIIAAAETHHPSRIPFYPRWKQVCWIQIPSTIADILDNRDIKRAILIIPAALCFTIYLVMLHVVGRYVKLFLVQIVPLRMRQLLVVHMVGRMILINYLPEIPYITRIARRVISPLSFFFPLDNAGHIATFASNLSRHTVLFFLELRDQTSYFIRGGAAKADNKRLAICKAKAYEVWKTVILTNAPIACLI